MMSQSVSGSLSAEAILSSDSQITNEVPDYFDHPKTVRVWPDGFGSGYGRNTKVILFNVSMQPMATAVAKIDSDTVLFVDIDFNKSTRQ